MRLRDGAVTYADRDLRRSRDILHRECDPEVVSRSQSSHWLCAENAECCRRNGGEVRSACYFRTVAYIQVRIATQRRCVNGEKAGGVRRNPHRYASRCRAPYNAHVERNIRRPKRTTRSDGLLARQGSRRTPLGKFRPPQAAQFTSSSSFLGTPGGLSSRERVAKNGTPRHSLSARVAETPT